MFTPEQAIKACNLINFVVNKGLPIRVFDYSQTDKIVRIEAGFRDKKVKFSINENGRYKYD